MSQNYTDRQNGGRFIDLCGTLDLIINDYPNLKNILCRFVLDRTFIVEPTRLYGYCTWDQCRLWDGKKDGRVQLPNFIIQWILGHNNNDWRITLDSNGRPSKGSKVTLTWLICYVWDVYPDQNIVGWENFECSHRCLCAGRGKSEYVCTWANHLCWESSSTNQSRGYNNCLQICHCGCGVTLCKLYNIHYPYCLYIV